jgi:UDP-N-acetylglucosamine 1-carboxyvinyltransferase
MQKLRITGQTSLNGTIRISGAKNSALKLLCASLLTEEIVHLDNVPNLADIKTLKKLLASLGVKYEIVANHFDKDIKAHIGRRIKLQSHNIHNFEASYDLVRTMRASVLVLGPLLARFGKAKVSLPGGCAIGTRPVDLHIKAMQAMGADIDITNGYIIATALKGLKGATIHFPFVSVGATENTLMAATLAKGETILQNAAREPEIIDIANFLISMGAIIEGAGTDTIKVQGVDTLHGTDYKVMHDRIELGTYVIAAGMTHGRLFFPDIDGSTIGSLLDILPLIGMAYEINPKGLSVWRTDSKIKSHDIITQPYPAFPTDLQAQYMTMMCLADGTSTIDETIFENRFMHVPELARMGADIKVTGNLAIVKGVQHLKAAPVMATDLRASVALVLAAIVAEGTSEVHRIYHLDRGYEAIEQKLLAVGANIERIQDIAA